MKFEINLVVFCLSVVLIGSSRIRGQSSVLAPVSSLTASARHTGTSESPELTEDPANEVLQQMHTPAGTQEASTETTTATTTTTNTQAEGAVHSHAGHTTDMTTTSPAVATSRHLTIPVITGARPGAVSPSARTTPQTLPPPLHTSTTEGGASPTTDPLATFSSPPAHTARASTLSQPEAPATATAWATTATARETTTTVRPLTSAGGRGPAAPTHQEVPSELNVGDEDQKGPQYRPSSPLDPLLAGLLSVFIITTAIVFIILFLKFRQRTNHPEFHRLQDLPMDDLMEDTPLSRYTY